MHRRGWIIFGAVIAVMVLIGVVGVTAANLNDQETSSDDVVRAINWHNYNYQYRVPITISNTGGALTDYQLQLTINTQALNTAGKMRSDCNDMRFTTSDGVTEVSYWIETTSLPAASTAVWVKVPGIAASPTQTTIYMYYGYSSETTSNSNGANTFIFFDDFESDVTGWTTSGSGTFTQVSSPIQHGSYAARFNDNGNQKYTVTSPTFTTTQNPIIVEYYAYPEQSNLILETQVMRSPTIGPGLRFGSTGNIQYNNAGAWTDIGAPAAYSAGTWYTFKLDRITWNSGTNNDIYDVYVGGTLRNSGAKYANDLNNTINQIAFKANGSNSDTPKMVIDLVKVRAYAASVPSASTGTEESL